MKLKFTIPFILGFIYVNAQTDSLAPYLRNPVLPQFSILKPDSVTWFTKDDLKRGRKSMIMLFSPDCDHCKKQTDIIVDNIDRLKDLEIVMTTFQPIEKMRRFYEKYELSKYPNIHVGRDVRYFFGPFYRFRYSPFLAIYDENEKLIKVYEGGAKKDKLLEVLR
jgi:thiol-disulfide isomerase/thioredoxin